MTFPAKVVDALLSGHGSGCALAKCGPVFPVNAEDWGPLGAEGGCTSCWLHTMRQPNIRTLRQAAHQSLLRELIYEAASKNKCSDVLEVLTDELIIGQWSHVPMAH